MNKIKKHQKPIDFDIHLKYLCQNCGQEHWLSFKETSTKNFKIVCECENTFGVKLTRDFIIKYTKKIRTNKAASINTELFNSAISSLIEYGFTSKEAKDLINTSYNKNPTTNLTILIKQSLELLKVKTNGK